MTAPSSMEPESAPAPAPKFDPAPTQVSARAPVNVPISSSGKTKSRFVLPSHAPAEPGRVAEVIEFSDAKPAAPASTANELVAEAPAPRVEAAAAVADIPSSNVIIPAPQAAPKPAPVYSTYPTTQTETVTTRR